MQLRGKGTPDRKRTCGKSRVPPETTGNWWCTLDADHEGPCAAIPLDDIEGNSLVPQTVQLGLVIDVKKADVAIVGPVQARVDLTLNFMSDGELSPNIPNPSVTAVIHQDGLVSVEVEPATVTWRDRELVTFADALDALARLYGYNPEGAEAMGFTELPLPAWVTATLAKNQRDGGDVSTPQVVDSLTGDAARKALLDLAGHLWHSPADPNIHLVAGGFLETPKGVITLELLGKLVSRGVQA